MLRISVTSPSENPLPNRSRGVARAAPADADALQKPLEAFRAPGRRLKIHPLELAALWLVGVHLVCMPWALGTMRPWAQIPSLILATLGLAVALLPRNYTEEHTGSNAFRLIMWPKLIRFPIFWIGLAALGYVALQALNPAWTYETDARGWWFMRRIESKPWLPQGFTAPFEKWNEWRMLIIYASAWATVCTIWVAFTRRRTLQLLLLTLVANGLLVALVGVVQKVTKTEKIFWFFESPNPAFFGSFIYKNHGAIYLFLTLAITCAVAAWYYVRGLRRMEKSNPSGVLVFFATFVAIAVLISFARGATFIMLIFLLGCLAGFVTHQFRLPKEGRKPVIAIALILMFGFFAKTGLDALRSDRAWVRLKAGIAGEDNSLKSRGLATQAALEMLGEHWKSGLGAGSFRFLFPVYQHRYPGLVADIHGPMFWEHAHNDIVQFPIELGALGIGLLLIGTGYWAVVLIKGYFWESPLSLCLVFGAMLVVLYAWWDFPFQCPAILTTWCVFWPVAAMWARIEESGGKG